MEVRILGPLEVTRGGTPLALGGTKQRAVFAMLALRVNRVVSMDFLVDGLWGTAPPTDPTNVVQVYLSRLRKALHPAGTPETRTTAALIRRKPGYLLQLDPEHLDLHRFQRLAREGSQLLPAAPDAAAAALTDALGLWRGVPLAEFTEEPFARDEIPRLEELRLNALTARIQADLAVGRHAELIGELEDLTVRYPLHEGLRGQLMLSLYRSGRQAEALEAYRRAREVFADELGIDPGRDLQDLEAAVLAHDPAWTGRHHPRHPPSPRRSPVGRPRADTAHGADHPGNARGAAAAGVERAGPQPALHRPRRAARPAAPAAARRPGHAGRAGAVRAGWGRQDPTRHRVRPPPRRRLRPGVVDRRRTTRAHPRPAHRSGQPARAAHRRGRRRGGEPGADRAGCPHPVAADLRQRRTPDGHRRLPAPRRRARPGDLPLPRVGRAGRPDRGRRAGPRGHRRAAPQPASRR